MNRRKTWVVSLAYGFVAFAVILLSLLLPPDGLSPPTVAIALGVAMAVGAGKVLERSGVSRAAYVLTEGFLYGLICFAGIVLLSLLSTQQRELIHFITAAAVGVPAAILRSFYLWRYGTSGGNRGRGDVGNGGH